MQQSKRDLAHVMSRKRPAGGVDTQKPPYQSKCGVTSRGISGATMSLLILLTTMGATGFYRFLARFSGRRRSWLHLSLRSGPPWALLVLTATSFFHLAEGCSSRTTPKPRPPAPTPRPNITFHTYVCPPAYATWYCQNGATCFTVKIGDSLLYNCECADGYMGPRCEYKDLEGSYFPLQRRYMLETASIAGGATIAVFLVVILCVVVYVHLKRKAKQTQLRNATNFDCDCVDAASEPELNNEPGFASRTRSRSRQTQPQVVYLRPPTFGTRWKQHPTTVLPHLTTQTATPPTPALPPPSTTGVTTTVTPTPTARIFHQFHDRGDGLLTPVTTSPPPMLPHSPGARPVYTHGHIGTDVGASGENIA